MIFQQFYLEGLGHASYLVGDEATGECLVLDARRDVDVYLEAARERGFRICHAIDTHGHNDYLSGITELIQRAAVQPLGFAEADLGYDHRAVKDGEMVELGDVGIEIVHTPGHTPEHVSLLVYDRRAGSEPVLLLSGGSLLVGDLGRPDLLGSREEAERAAESMCRAVRERILSLPDGVAVWPTHVSGSLCGANIGSRLSTTVGYERRSNGVLAKLSEPGEPDAGMLLEHLPAVPPYWRRMRAQNLAGPRALGVLGEPPALSPSDFEAARQEGALVVDARATEAHAGGHVPQALNVGLGPSFATWAGTILPEEARILLVLDRPQDLWGATWMLLRVGYDLPRGWLAGGMVAWRTSGRPSAVAAQLAAREAHRRLAAGELDVLDVRQPAEWAAGHVAGAVFISGAEVPARLGEVPDGLPLAVVCGSGYRSSVIASLLRARGREAVNIVGGMEAWSAAGLPIER